MDFGTMSLASILRLCRSALSDEMDAIRKMGTKPLLLSDGQRLGEEADGGYLYSFTLDAEIILPDDAPGKLDVGGETAQATVVSISGFTILLLVMQDIGPSVRSARLITDATFLLAKLRERLGTLAGYDDGMGMAGKLLAPFLKERTASMPDQACKAPDSSGTLNLHQQHAVEKVRTSEISFVWGPPGTGKTTTLGHAVAALLRQGESVLVLAHSNAAVDAAAKAVGAQASEMLLFARGGVQRVGISREPGLDKRMVPREIIRRRHPELIIAIEDLERERDRLTRQLSRNAGEAPGEVQSRLSEVRKQLQHQRGELRSAERAAVAHARCVLCTLSKMALADEIFTRSFDAVIVDEASMAYVPAALFAASLARRRVAVFGDFRQLPPIVHGKTLQVKEWLQPDIFSKAGVVKHDKAQWNDPRLVMLAEQYRMHPEIAGVIARQFYDSKLSTGITVEQRCVPITARPPKGGSPLLLVDTGALGPFAEKEARDEHAGWHQGGNSRFNLVSAIIAVEVALAASREGEEPVGVGIITPYAAQARLISKLLHDLAVPRERVMCATVHRFQGSERDIIVYDTVEGKPFTRAGWLLTGDGSDVNVAARLLNVALSRAKGKLIVLADLAHLRSVLPGGNVYQRVLADIQGHVHAVRAAAIPGSGRGIALSRPLAGIDCLVKECAGPDLTTRQRLADDLRSAEIVALAGTAPVNSSLAALLGDLGAISLRPATRVEIGTQALPKITARDHRWKGPDLPCLVLGLDQRTIWVEGSSLLLRIAQPQTVKLLYGLWGLLPESMRAIKTTEEQRELARRGQSPLARACPACGSPLWASVEHGRAALICPNASCRHTSSFTPATATQYADFSGARCPVCGGQLEGHQGLDGIYLRCANHPHCKGWRRLKEIV